MPNKNKIPNGWICCPSKANSLIEAFKTPLSKRYDHKIPNSARFTLSMLLSDSIENKIEIGLIFNLTDTNRYYDAVNESRENNIEYQKINCPGHRAPNVQQTQFFINTCHNFFRKHPHHSIGVHCTHGYNRTGFLICSYLIEKLGFSVEEAITSFGSNRPPGIYRQNIINDLYGRYGGPNDEIVTAVKKPDWHHADKNEPVNKNFEINNLV